MFIAESWPTDRTSENGVESAKVPTRLRYLDDSNQQAQWGYQISPDAPDDEILEYFKL